jgi:hypothetical protein
MYAEFTQLKYDFIVILGLSKSLYQEAIVSTKQAGEEIDRICNNALETLESLKKKAAKDLENFQKQIELNEKLQKQVLISTLPSQSFTELI